jgi:predicted acetyltransferase
MNEIKLIKPSLDDKKRVLDFKRECLESGENEIHGDGGLDEIDDYKEWFKKITLDSDLKNCEKTWVPATVYLAIRHEDNNIVGIVQIRHRLNESLLNYGGNIGFEVRPSERNKGYATEILRLALEKCREMKMEKRFKKMGEFWKTREWMKKEKPIKDIG